MKTLKKKIAFFGSSIVSAYWNGAATYYRGMIRALAELGYTTTFYEPLILDRQRHRDIADPGWCKVVIYESTLPALDKCLEEAASADIIVKASGVGVFDDYLEKSVPSLKNENNLIIFWDVDAPATLDRLHRNDTDPFHDQIPKFDLVLTYGGGDPVTQAYHEQGASLCFPVYNALDTSTHFPVARKKAFSADLAFLGNRLPDREKRVRDYFLDVAKRTPQKTFLLGGSGWHDLNFPENVTYKGHVYTRDHNAFYCSPLAVLNISRDSMATYGFSPATRVFEAAGAGACIITDQWPGIETFFEPEKEILVADSGKEVEKILLGLTKEKAKKIGEAAFEKVRKIHTYSHRAKFLHQLFIEYGAKKEGQDILKIN
ncbi:CgeB family protein [Negadavirga shengliensis]|uniref:Glycosyltransferase n=1 Tax=Negadavirga shengliensis TaxID=1389218 RepID=A0ABV9T689_9BACT